VKNLRENVNLFSISERENKVSIDNFAKVAEKNQSFSNFLETLPSILKVNELKELVVNIIQANKNSKLISVGMGAHVIKTGLSPLLIDAMKKGVINHIALNGAGPIHDFEIAFQGKTSEDVARGLEDGTFGMIKETGDFFYEALNKYKKEGYGWAAGKLIEEKNLPFKESSILAAAYNLNIPVTVHAAIGTDIIYQNPKINGEDIGTASLADFDKFTNLLPNLDNGGVFLNFGSAVIIPEVFLKALTIARNSAKKPYNFFTANFDMMLQYRPQFNILSRPVKKGNGYHFTGHHEIMLPLFFAMINENI